MQIHDVTIGSRFYFDIRSGGAVMVRDGSDVSPQEARRRGLCLLVLQGTMPVDAEMAIEAAGYGSRNDPAARWHFCAKPIPVSEVYLQ